MSSPYHDIKKFLRPKVGTKAGFRYYIIRLLKRHPGGDHCISSLDLYRKGPPKWTKVYAEGRVYKAQRYMNKFYDNLKDKDDR